MQDDPLPDGLPLCDAAGSRDVMCSRKSSGSTRPGEECTTVHPAGVLQPDGSYRTWRVAALEFAAMVASACGWRVYRVVASKSTDSVYLKIGHPRKRAARVRISSHPGGCRGPRQFSVMMSESWRLADLRTWLVQLQSR